MQSLFLHPHNVFLSDDELFFVVRKNIDKLSMLWALTRYRVNPSFEVGKTPFAVRFPGEVLLYHFIVYNGFIL